MIPTGQTILSFIILTSVKFSHFFFIAAKSWHKLPGVKTRLHPPLYQAPLLQTVDMSTCLPVDSFTLSAHLQHLPAFTYLDV